MINSDEANEVIQSRHKRASQGWSLGWSYLEKECFEDDFCRKIEDFKEGAENDYPAFKREDPEVHRTWTLYNSCHYGYLEKKGNKCSGNSCECNVPFKKWLKSHYPS